MGIGLKQLWRVPLATSVFRIEERSVTSGLINEFRRRRML